MKYLGIEPLKMKNDRKRPKLVTNEEQTDNPKFFIFLRLPLTTPYLMSNKTNQ